MTHTLVAVVGLTPQVVTETVWALAQVDPSELPQHIVVVTTQAGRRYGERLQDALTRLYAGFNGTTCPKVEWVLSGDYDLADSVQVSAFRRCLAGALAPVVVDPSNVLHLSVAGGRNSMVSAATGVFEMLCRPGDRLTQVLLDPPEIERAEGFNEFWFPTDSANPAEFDYQPWDKSKHCFENAVPLRKALIQLRLVDLPFTPLAAYRGTLVGEVKIEDRVRLFDSCMAERLSLRADLQTKWLVLETVGPQTVIGIGPSGGTAPAGVAPGIVLSLEPKELALLWWIVLETHLNPDQGACWEQPPDKCADPFLRYLRLLAWLCDGEQVNTANEAFARSAMRSPDGKTVHQGEFRRIRDAHSAQASRSVSNKMGPGQTLSHLKCSLRPLGPLAEYLVDDSQPGRCRVDPLIRIEAFALP